MDGAVAAVNTFDIKSKDMRQPISGGVPSSFAIPFIQEHIPDWMPIDMEMSALEWPDVAERAGQSTVLFTILHKDAAPVLTAAASNLTDGAYLTDRSCAACNGSRQLPCPTRGCARGTIKEHYVITIEQQLAEPIRIPATRRVACPTCGGNDSIACPHCGGTGTARR